MKYFALGKHWLIKWKYKHSHERLWKLLINFFSKHIDGKISKLIFQVSMDIHFLCMWADEQLKLKTLARFVMSRGWPEDGIENSFSSFTFFFPFLLYDKQSIAKGVGRTTDSLYRSSKDLSFPNMPYLYKRIARVKMEYCCHI